MTAAETQAGAVPHEQIDWTTIDWRTVNQTAAPGTNRRVIMPHDEQACGTIYRPGEKSRVAPGPVDPALLHAIDIAVKFFRRDAFGS